MGEQFKRGSSSHSRIGIAPAGLTVVSFAALAGSGAHASIVYDNGSPNPVNAPVSSLQNYSIDFDQDSSTEAEFNVSATPDGSALKLSLQNGEAISDATNYPLPLAQGTIVGPNPSNGSYTSAGGAIFNGGGGVGYFLPGTPGYIGFEFTSGLDSSLHYGWAQFETTSGDTTSPTGTVIDFAYDNSPNTPIAAGAVPEPTSLSLLAAGAAGLAMYRGRRRA
jgi:hypothetical protein